MNYDVSTYTLSELLAICKINHVTKPEIMEKTQPLIEKYKTKNPTLSVFFEDAQKELLQYIQSSSSSSSYVPSQPKTIEPTLYKFRSGEKQVSDWYTNEVLQQHRDPVQTDKITDRKQKIELFGNEHVPMNRQQIATTDTYTLPVKQDSLNPNLKNTINRFVNLDSQYRQYTSGPDSMSTNFTCDLSDTLKNALSLSVYSYQVPYSWYTIDQVYGNTCFWIYSGPQTTPHFVCISVPSGNYTPAQLVTQLQQSFSTAGFNFPEPNTTTFVTYNTNNGKLSFQLQGGQWTDPEQVEEGVQFTITTESRMIFYDFTGQLSCTTTCAPSTAHYFNNTLGWVMGFRVPYVMIDAPTITAPCILDLNGTKYLILVIDDYNQNHVNNSLVSITQITNTLKMPSYYSADVPVICLTPTQQGNNLQTLMNDLPTTSDANGLLIAGKYEQDYTPTAIAVPSAPRTLTNAQLYTINAINANNNNLTNYLAKAPTSSDILAVLPIKTSSSSSTGSMLVDFSGSLQQSTRTYFGPVNIERLAVKLLDDKGNILNLNGCDWCVTLVAQCLYQY